MCYVGSSYIAGRVVVVSEGFSIPFYSHNKPLMNLQNLSVIIKTGIPEQWQPKLMKNLTKIKLMKKILYINFVTSFLQRRAKKEKKEERDKINYVMRKFWEKW